MCISPIVEPCFRASQQTMDACSRIATNTDATSNVAKVAGTVIQLANMVNSAPVFTSLVQTFNTFGGLVGARSWISTTNDLVTGKTAWYHPLSTVIPNVARVASRIAVGISQGCMSLCWLDSVGVLSLAAFASTTGFQFFGIVALKAAQNSLGLIGWSLDLLDMGRIMYQEGFTMDTWLTVASDVAKIAAIALALSTVPYATPLAMIAGGTGSAIALVTFLRKEYGLSAG